MESCDPQQPLLSWQLHDRAAVVHVFGENDALLHRFRMLSCVGGGRVRLHLPVGPFHEHFAAAGDSFCWRRRRRRRRRRSITGGERGEEWGRGEEQGEKECDDSRPRHRGGEADRVFWVSRKEELLKFDRRGEAGRVFWVSRKEELLKFDR